MYRTIHFRKHRMDQIRLFTVVAFFAVFLASSISLGIVKPISAAGTYYVDSSAGSDGNPGTLERPWQTIAKVNGTSFGPGDRVLFHRGGTWGELSISSQAGMAAAPITYGTYGSGANPSIQGVRVKHSRYVVLEDLTIERSVDVGVSIVGDSEYITFARCLIRDNATYGVTIWTPGQGNFSILDSVVRDNGTAQVRSSGIFAKANNMVIARSEIYNNAAGDPAWGYSHGIYIDTETTGAQIYDNEIHGNRRGHGATSKGSAEIFRNYLHDNGIAGLLLSGHDVPVNTSTTYRVYSNVATRNAFGIAEYGKSSSNPMRVYIYHNTLYANTASWGADLYIEDPLTALEIVNNAVYPAAGENGYEIATQGAARIDNNVVYHGSTPVIQYGGKAYTWSGWQGLGYDTRGLNANPGFVNAGEDDFHLRSDSVCINAGTDVGVRLDFAGQPVPSGAGFDIGAYEYQGAGVSPTATLTQVPATATATPTRVPPTTTVTATPTRVPATATATATATPTRVPPTATVTATPTRIPATTTPAPATATPVPTQPPSSELSWEAEAGTLASPFAVSGGLVSQSILTVNPASGGRVAYRFSLGQPGAYVVMAMVEATSEGSNSFFVNIDGEPTGDAMVWDIAVTEGIQERTASWRGAGSESQNEFNPRVFQLSAGTHELVVRGREGGTRLSSLRLMPATWPSLGEHRVYLPFVTR